ncbi:hypothetical protein [Proteiniphilum sp.]|uniref:hypothetical protein n=1 Tax=Proteiniphilum sp. TaxID=1926877 RepID=UPI002B2216A5|nr:hypothetical protein [Proteiniphilum sp.]MEA4918371.1 hypothetical protein [Proteiniphilum sp.]
MKKTNTFLIITSLLIVISTIACNQQNKKSEESGNKKFEIADPEVSKSQFAETLYERLMSSFGDDWMEREADPNLYPDYYGGSFVDDNGSFVVTVTGNREENVKRLTEILGTNNFKVETVQYSYQQMMKVMDNIDVFLMNSDIPEDHPLMNCFAGAYPDVKKNRVKVLLTKTDDATIRLFQKDVVNSPLVIFEKGEQPELM